MQLFYDPDLAPGVHQLRDAEAAHAVRVLRKRVGDELNLVDGRGGRFTGKLIEAGKRGCVLDVAEISREAHRAAYGMTLLVAPTKNIDRFEWLLEKATEIGIDRVRPILTEHSERKKIRPDRLERVIESAMKQSLSAWLPELLPLQPFAEAISGFANGQNYLAYLGGEDTPLLHRTYSRGTNVTVAIGPEGGFSPAEASFASENGFTLVSLGPNRLRTETAAVAAVHSVAQLNW